MKIRNGFVSNSSSSSFVVALDEDKIQETKVCECCGQNISTNFFERIGNVIGFEKFGNYYPNIDMGFSKELIENIEKFKRVIIVDIERFYFSEMDEFLENSSEVLEILDFYSE